MSGNFTDASKLQQQLRQPSSGMTEEDKLELYESSRTDSGFISSGSIIVSGEIGISEEVDRKSSNINNSATALKTAAAEVEGDYMRLDSGLGLELTKSFSSSQSYYKSSGLNDLSSGSVILTTSATPSLTKPVDEEQQPWELYYKQDENGDTLLHDAIIEGFLEVTLALIRAAPSPALLDTANDDALTPIHLAVATGQWRIARWLIVAGARPCPRNLQGDSPLHIAARTGDIYSCKAITDAVQQQERDVLNLKYPPQPYQQCDLDQWNYDGQTCVHVAAINGHVDVLRHLVWYGADINAREGKSGYTALHYAIENGNEKLAHFLLSDCDRLDVDVETYGGRTVLELGNPITHTLEEALKSRGVPSPYPSDDEYDDDDDEDDSDEEMVYEATNLFKKSLVIDASA